MDTQTWIYLAVGGSFLLYFVIAIASRAGSTEDFYAHENLFARVYATNAFE